VSEPTIEPTDESLSEVFWSVSRRLRQATQEALAPWDISPSHARALRVLAHHEALRLSELAEHLHIAPRSTTEVVDALQTQGLVARRPDPDDRRATLVELSRHGHDVLAAIRAARGSEAERFFDRLTPTDQTQLVRILRKLT
jgi:DNA-binding MarR family transcriptional regulator